MINCSFYSASFVPTVDDIRSLESLNKFLLYKLTNGISLFMKGVLLMLNVKHNHSWLYRKWLAIKRWCFVFVWFIIAIWYLNCDRLKLTLHSSNSEIVHYENMDSRWTFIPAFHSNANSFVIRRIFESTNSVLFELERSFMIQMRHYLMAFCILEI